MFMIYSSRRWKLCTLNAKEILPSIFTITELFLQLISPLADNSELYVNKRLELQTRHRNCFKLLFKSVFIPSGI